MSNGISMERVEAIVDSYGCQRSNLIAIMQDIQAENKYLSPAILEKIAETLDIGVAKVYSVATFYENFSLEAKGKYIIKVCDGTACHVRKSQPIYDAIREHLKLQGKQKTGKEKANPIIAGTSGAELKVWHEKPIPAAYSTIDTDLALDNLENDMTLADLQDL